MKAGKIKKVKWPTRRRQTIHSHKSTTSTQSSQLQELVHLTSLSITSLEISCRTFVKQRAENAAKIWVALINDSNVIKATDIQYISVN